MSRKFDVVIVGGGVVGSSAAYFLASQQEFGGSIAVVERDATYAEAATPRSAGGIRQQFSTPENVLISAFGASFIKTAKDHLTVGTEEPNLQFHEGGYLFLATGAGLSTLIANQQLQHQLGADTQLLNSKELAANFPWLNCADLAGGSFGPRNEGWLDPYSLLQAFRRKAPSLGVTSIQDEVGGLDIAHNRVTSVSLRSGEKIECGAVINCAGINAWRIAAWIGLDLPGGPRKRLVYVIDCRGELPDGPRTMDPTGGWRG